MCQIIGLITMHFGKHNTIPTHACFTPWTKVRVQSLIKDSELDKDMSITGFRERAVQYYNK